MKHFYRKVNCKKKSTKLTWLIYLSVHPPGGSLHTCRKVLEEFLGCFQSLSD